MLAASAFDIDERCCRFDLAMDAFDYNFAHSLAVFASVSKTGEVQESRDVLLTNSRAPRADFNQGVFKTPDYKFDRTLERVRAFQDRVRVPLRLHLSSSHASLGLRLLDAGYIEAAPIPAMILDPIGDSLAAEISGLSIRRVASAPELDHFGALAFGSFGYALDFAAVALTSDLLDLPHVELYVGYLDDVPAGCSMLIVTGHVAGIYWVGVRDDLRRRGVGAAVTAHAALAGKRHGCTVASLQASPMGAPVYRRLGFEKLREYLRFDLAFTSV